MDLLLFSKGDLGQALSNTARKVGQRLLDWNADALLGAAAADVIEELIDDGSVRCPTLLRGRVWMSPPSETVVQVPAFGDRSLVDRRLHRLTVHVPFDGEQVIFTLRANRWSGNPPRVFALNDQELTIAVDGPAPDGKAVRAGIDGQLDGIDEHLSWSRLQIDEHNRKLQADVPGMVARRREDLLRVRNLQAAIGFPSARAPTRTRTPYLCIGAGCDPSVRSVVALAWRHSGWNQPWTGRLSGRPHRLSPRPHSAGAHSVGRGQARRGRDPQPPADRPQHSLRG